jgi:hypothetical protein
LSETAWEALEKTRVTKPSTPASDIGWVGRCGGPYRFSRLLSCSRRRVPS